MFVSLKIADQDQDRQDHEIVWYAQCENKRKHFGIKSEYQTTAEPCAMSFLAEMQSSIAEKKSRTVPVAETICYNYLDLCSEQIVIARYHLCV